MHISEQVAAELIAEGWSREGADFRFSKVVPTGGAFGETRMTLVMDETGRWLESIDGWGNAVRVVDLREHQDNPKGAIAAVLA